MKELKKFLYKVWARIDDGLRRICGRPTPMKRFLTVLFIGSALAVANIYFVVSSIYNMGKRDAEMKFLELQHIESVKIKNDSINILNHKKDEYNKSK